MLYVVLAVLCISVTYMFLSLELWSTARSRQAKRRIAKPSIGVGSFPKRPSSHGGQM